MADRGDRMAWVDKVTAAGGTTATFNKIGDSAEGLYVGVQFDANGKFGPTNKHLLKTPKGVTVVYAKPNGQLDDLFKGETGKLVKVTFTGTKPSTKGNPMKLYKLQTEDSIAQVSADELPTFAANSEDEEIEETEEFEQDDEIVARAAAASESAAARKAKVDALLGKNRKA